MKTSGQSRRPRLGGAKLILLVILAAAVGAGGSYGVLSRQQPAKDAHGKNAHKAKEKEAARAKGTGEVAYVNLGAFLVNLVSASGLRYLRTEVTLGIEGLEAPKGGEGKKELALPPAEDALVRDAIVRILSQQSFDDLRLRGPRDELKQAIIQQLSASLKEHKIVAVLFTSFVMQ